MNLSQFLESQGNDVYRAARGLVERVDDDQLDWKPQDGANWMTTGQLLRHIAIACGEVAECFVTGDWGKAESGVDPNWKGESPEQMPPAEAYLPSTKAECLERLDADHALWNRMIAQAGEERLATETSVAPWGGPERPLAEHFASCLAHLESHKSQLFYYLKLQGKPMNTGTLWGMAS